MSERFVTPEAVALRHEHAGLGSRSVALVVDGIIQTVLFLAIMLGVSAFELEAPAQLAVAVVLAATFFLHLGYFTVFEALWGGQTPGKRLARLRVVRIDGQPLGWTAAVVRNVLRLVDSLFFYAVGAVAMMISSDDQRLGDMAAGTVVIHEPTSDALRAVPHAEAAAWVTQLDVRGLSDREYALARSFLQRRGQLSVDARARIAHEVATTLRARVHGVPDGVPDEEIVETLVAAVRQR